MKKCPPGEYYCHDMKKCKKIPSGYHVGARGYLEQDDDNGKKNGNGNGTNGNGHSNGNGSNGNGGGVSESTRIPSKIGNIIDVYVGWRGKGYMIKIFFKVYFFKSNRHYSSPISILPNFISI